MVFLEARDQRKTTEIDIFPLFQNEVWCVTFRMKMSLTCTFIVLHTKLILHMKGCATELVLKHR